MNFIRQGLGIALQPELTLKSIAGELCSVPLELDLPLYFQTPVIT
ncbi:putative transcriptional regulator domain protein [Escherichia coli 2-052-05_S4_C3]|nr:putative transcriptional regulator domain protein [Escherichia coli 2-052-05_S4_C3]